jgi:hypothetical protein
MVKKVGKFLKGVGKGRSGGVQPRRSPRSSGGDRVRILKKGPAMRVIFFYPGEEGTYVDNAEVTLFDNGIIHIQSNQEETTTHLQNCEILWRFETDAEDRANKLRLLKPKSDSRAAETELLAKKDVSSDDEESVDGKPGKGNSSKNPELR